MKQACSLGQGYEDVNPLVTASGFVLVEWVLYQLAPKASVGRWQSEFYPHSIVQASLGQLSAGGQGYVVTLLGMRGDGSPVSPPAVWPETHERWALKTDHHGISILGCHCSGELL